MPEVVTPAVTSNFASDIATFIQQYFWLFVLGFIGIWVVMQIVSFSSKKPKTVSRGEVEKQKRIEELKYCGNVVNSMMNLNGLEMKTSSNYDSLFHGNRWLGSITNISQRQEKIMNNGNEVEKEILEIVFRPKFFRTIADPFKKDLLRIFKECLILDSSKKSIIILPTISLDNFIGYYYDVPNEIYHKNWVNDQIFKHDKEDTSAFYFVESQKRSTFDLEFAHELAMKEKEIQLELAKKRGKMTSI